MSELPREKEKKSILETPRWKIIKWFILIILLLISGGWFLSFYIEYRPWTTTQDGAGSADSITELRNQKVL